ncbi:MAG: toxin-antitoxin system YwqK family antitoxin [Bacteroidetes bacterium]|nr:toxin-antitoxin system YwqK family antitoxin [Bacteroidota bacterium]
MPGKLFAILTVSIVLSSIIVGAEQNYDIDPTSGDTVNYKDKTNMRQGHWIFTGKMKRMAEYEEDQVVEEGSYKNSRKNGLWKRYFANRQLRSEVNYRNNKADGDYKEYYSDGTLQESGTWKNGKNVGDFERKHPNGAVAQKFSFNEKGKREGSQEYYFDNGQLRIKGNWQAGQENGVVTEYTSTGEVKSKKFYNEGGTLDNAKTKVYDVKEVNVEPPPPEPDQAVKDAVKVQKDEKKNIGFFTGEGHHILYRKDGQVSKDGDFKVGQIWKGKVYIYNKDGILTGISIIKKGRYVGEGVIEEPQK